MATSRSPHPIPLTYRILFTYIDPLFCLLGFTTHLFAPTNTMAGYSDYAITPSAPSTIFLLDNMAGFFGMLFVLEGVLLRYVRSRDAGVWRVVQAGGVVVDVCMVVGAVKMLSSEGRLMDVGNWRGDDWKNVVGNVAMGVFRAGVALGVGMEGGEDGKRRVA